MPKDNAFAPQNDLLRSLAESGLALTYDQHALKQMGERKIWRQDVKCVLENGRIIGTEIAYENEERWRVKGENVDGFPLTVVIRAITTETTVIYVITAFEPS